MSTPKIFESEYRFMQILWENEPIKSNDLVRLCEEMLGWKRSTTFTVIKRLSERGAVINENTVVRSLVSRDEVLTLEAEELLKKRFDCSVPSFIETLVRGGIITREELLKLKELIEEYEEKVDDT